MLLCYLEFIQAVGPGGWGPHQLLAVKEERVQMLVGRVYRGIEVQLDLEHRFSTVYNFYVCCRAL